MLNPKDIFQDSNKNRDGGGRLDWETWYCDFFVYIFWLKVILDECVDFCLTRLAYAVQTRRLLHNEFGKWRENAGMFHHLRTTLYFDSTQKARLLKTDEKEAKNND